MNNDEEKAPDTTRTRSPETVGSIPERYKNKQFKFPFDEDTKVRMEEEHYSNNGRLRINLVTVPEHEGDFSEPFATITTNLPDQELGEDEFFVKIWNENAGLIGPLLKSGVFVQLHGRAETTWKFTKGRTVQFEQGEALEEEVVRARSLGASDQVAVGTQQVLAKNVPLGEMAWRFDQPARPLTTGYYLGRRLQVAPVCPYCSQVSRIVTGETIYPGREDLADKQFWFCAPCNAYVGCHQGTPEPLGRLANAELRLAKMAAHTAFDAVWRSGRMKRSEAYRQLAKHLELNVDACHIGMFDLETCRRVVVVASLI